MAQTLLFALIASSALVIGALIGVLKPPPTRVTAVLLAFASGALITAVAFDLFAEAFDHGGPLRAGAGLLLGAGVFIALDLALEKLGHGSSGLTVGLALLAAVTLDGIPENLAMGVALIESASPALLVAIFASNLPEAIVGAKRMRESDVSRVVILGVWSATALVLALAVILGYAALAGIEEEALAWPLGFAGGAVLASLADTLMPEAYRDGGPAVAFATALGFLVSFLVSGASGLV